VLTHGFVVDEHGKKMSKSRGNSVSPQEVMAESGDDVLRLWVSMADYREDMRLGKEILARVVEAYRKIRNVLRVLTANLYDFDPAADAVPRSSMQEIDRWVMARYAQVATRIVSAYDNYDYPAVYQAANSFITVDLSAFYVDVTKDRMYTFGGKSLARRSGQTAMHLVADGLARLLAPILPFTTDELWRNLPGRRAASVHLTTFPDAHSGWTDDELLERWGQLATVRDQVNVALEEKRQQKAIKSNLSAKVRLAADADRAVLLQQYRDELPALFGVSQVEVLDTLGELIDESLGRGTELGAPVQVEIDKADGVRCERCWRYVPRVSDDPHYAGLCDRCVDALAENGPAVTAS
jgi:isoleucyl-tRNA synthetase